MGKRIYESEHLEPVLKSLCSDPLAYRQADSSGAGGMICCIRGLIISNVVNI